MDGFSKTTFGSSLVLRRAIADRRKLVAHRLGRATSLVDRWVIDPPSEKNPEGNGVPNPLDLLIALLKTCEMQKGHEALDWLCHQFGGDFIPRDGGRGDGKLFRDIKDSLPHIEWLRREIKNKAGPSRKLLAIHLQEAYCIISSHLAREEQ